MKDMGDVGELDRALDRLLAGEEIGPAPATAPLIELAFELRSALPLELSAEARATHLALIEARPAAAASAIGVGRRVAVIGLAAAIAVSLFGSAAFAASSSARPGDTLFGVKRAFERVGLAMHRGRESRTAFAFELVRRRMSELRAASGGKGAERARVAYEEALAEADRLLGTSSDFNDALLSHVEEELHKHVVVLNDLLERVPEEARAGIQRAIDNASKAEERAARGREKRESGEPPRGDRTPGRAGRSSKSSR